MPEPIPPVDKNVRIPAGVVAAGAMADSLQRQALGIVEPPDPNAPPVPPTPPGNEPPAPPPPEVPMEEAEIAALPPPAANDELGKKWHHAYRSLKGRFDHAMPRANQNVADLTAQIQAQSAEIARLRAAPPVTPVAPTAVQLTDEELGLTPEQIADYGPELVETMRKIATASASKAMQVVDGRVTSMANQTAAEREQRMVDWLQVQLPNLLEVNQQPEFKTWLALPDPYSGAMKQTLLEQAFAAADGPRVLAIFKGFLAATTPPTASTPQPPAVTPATTPLVAPSNRIALVDLAAPGRSQSSAPGSSPPAPEQKPVYKKSDITAFYHDVTRGMYRGKDAEKAEIERAIFSATIENRIIDG